MTRDSSNFLSEADGDSGSGRLRPRHDKTMSIWRDWSDLNTYYQCMMQLMYDSSWQPGYISTPGYCLMIERRSVFNLCRVFSVLCGDHNGMWGGTRMTRHKTQESLSLSLWHKTQESLSLSLCDTRHKNLSLILWQKTQEINARICSLIFTVRAKKI